MSPIALGASTGRCRSTLQHQLAEMTSVLEQNLRGAKIVKAFAQEDAEIKRFDEENGKWFNLAQAQVVAMTKHIPAARFHRQLEHSRHHLAWGPARH